MEKWLCLRKILLSIYRVFLTFLNNVTLSVVTITILYYTSLSCSHYYTKHAIFTMICIVCLTFLHLYSLHAHRKYCSNLIFLYSNFSFYLILFNSKILTFKLLIISMWKNYIKIYFQNCNNTMSGTPVPFLIPLVLRRLIKSISREVETLK